MEEVRTIHVNIADRSYPIKVASEEEEERIRKNVKQINNIINLYKENYNADNKDNQDFLAMTALHLATDLTKVEQNKDMTRIIEKLDQLNNELSDYLLQKS